MAIISFSLFKVVVMKMVLLGVLGIGNLLGKEFHSTQGLGSWTLIVFRLCCPSSPEIEKKLVEERFRNHIDPRQWQEVCLLSLLNGLKN